MSKAVRNIITIGASAGGIAAVTRLCAGFSKGIDAALFIVIHLSRESVVGVVLSQIQKKTTLPCKVPANGDPIENGHIYIAPPDRHMMLEKGRIIVQKGAYENHWRPSIDVLFRTAAAAYDSCVTGIILTGMLDDGSSGMSAIKRSGGRCMIQDPQEAEYPDMPNNVLRNVTVDYKGSLEEIAYVLSDLYTRSECENAEVPRDVKLEAEITIRMSSNVEDLEPLGTLTPFTCPDCGGTLVQITHEKAARYRCYTGHSFTQASLAEEQNKKLEESLWVAIRMMEERKNLLNAMSSNDDGSRTERAQQIRTHITRLKDMLKQVGSSGAAHELNDREN
jgi:two-component system chemotaxis response regulator CheB